MKPFARLFSLFALAMAVTLLLPGCEVASSSGSNDNNDNDNTTGKGDRAKIVGTWRVDSDWRWSQMTFKSDGSRSVVDRTTGQTLTRGSWSLKNGKLVVVSDVTEEWDYVVTATTLTATLPSGTVVHMTKID